MAQEAWIPAEAPEPWLGPQGLQSTEAAFSVPARVVTQEETGRCAVS